VQTSRASKNNSVEAMANGHAWTRELTSGAPGTDRGLSEFRRVFHEHQELVRMNQALRESSAEWTSAIGHVLSLFRRATAERESLVQHLTSHANDDHVLLQWIRMSEEVRSPTFSDLLRHDQFAGVLESTTAVSASTIAPELDEVPAPRLSVSVEHRFDASYYEAIPPQRPPLTRYSQSPVAMQLFEDHAAQQAGLTVLRQQIDDRQGGRRRERRRRQRRRQMNTLNRQNRDPFQVVSQMDQEHMQLFDAAPYTQHHSPVQVSHLSDWRQFGQHQRQHNPHPSIISSAGTSLSHGRAMFVVDKLPKAAAAA